MMKTLIKQAGKSALDVFAYSTTIIFIFSLILKINLYDSLGNLFLMVSVVSLGVFTGEYRRSKDRK